MDAFQVSIGKEALTFAAAHFIAWEDGGCERLHGHNYRVAVTLEGRVNEAGYVIDFLALREAAEAVLDELDHRVLLPEAGERIQVSREGERVRVRCAEREWVFPAGDVRILPIDNTTSERLAGLIAERLAVRLQAGGEAPGRLEVEVEESPGLAARHTREPGSERPGAP